MRFVFFASTSDDVTDTGIRTTGTPCPRIYGRDETMTYAAYRTVPNDRRWLCHADSVRETTAHRRSQLLFS